MRKVILHTQVYNGEKTLRRTIESVLRQSYTDFTYFILDNASTDKSGKIIAEYAQLDSRIEWVRVDINYPLTFVRDVSKFADTYPDGCWAMLDADDEYKPDFLEKSLAFMAENRLDITACGSDFVDARTGQYCGVRKLARDVILEGIGFSEHFPVYHQFMRTVWCKLYSLSLLRQCNFERCRSVSYGADTMFAMEAFRNASRVGILAGSLHKYYVSPASVSYAFDDTRIKSDVILPDLAREFLVSKTGAVSPRNEEFLLAVYMNALFDTLKVLLGSGLSESEKFDGLCEMFLCGRARQLASQEGFGALLGDPARTREQRRQLFAAAANFLFRLKVPSEQAERYCEAGEFVSAAADDDGMWIAFKKLLVRFLIYSERNEEAQAKLDELLELLPDDEELLAYRQ